MPRPGVAALQLIEARATPAGCRRRAGTAGTPAGSVNWQLALRRKIDKAL